MGRGCATRRIGVGTGCATRIVLSKIRISWSGFNPTTIRTSPDFWEEIKSGQTVAMPKARVRNCLSLEFPLSSRGPLSSVDTRGPIECSNTTFGSTFISVVLFAVPTSRNFWRVRHGKFHSSILRTILYRRLGQVAYQSLKRLFLCPKSAGRCLSAALGSKIAAKLICV